MIGRLYLGLEKIESCMEFSSLIPEVRTNFVYASKDSHLETIIGSIHKAALELGIAIIGGHTGFYPGFSAPTIGGIRVLGITEKDKYVTPAMVQPGNEIMLTKGPAIEATGILSVFKEKELSEKNGSNYFGKSKGTLQENNCR